MSEFDNFIRGIGSDIKTAAEQVGKKAEETFEISKRRVEKIKLKGKIQASYEKLGELVYGSIKNGEDVEEEVAVIVEQLDADFERVSEIFAEINAIKNGTFVSKSEDEEMDWEEEYAEGYDEDESEEDSEDEEVEVSIVMMENDGEIVEEPATIETEEEQASDGQEFDINID